jgi:hypothetical protein
MPSKVSKLRTAIHARECFFRHTFISAALGRYGTWMVISRPDDAFSRLPLEPRRTVIGIDEA